MAVGPCAPVEPLARSGFRPGSPTGHYVGHVPARSTSPGFGPAPHSRGEASPGGALGASRGGLSASIRSTDAGRPPPDGWAGPFVRVIRASDVMGPYPRVMDRRAHRTAEAGGLYQACCGGALNIGCAAFPRTPVASCFDTATANRSTQYSAGSASSRRECPVPDQAICWWPARLPQCPGGHSANSGNILPISARQTFRVPGTALCGVDLLRPGVFMKGDSRRLIRRADRRDALGIARVHVASWQAAYRGHLPDAYLVSLCAARRCELWEQALADDRVLVGVAESCGAIDGFVIPSAGYQEGADSVTGELTAIYIRPDFWRCGVGRQLMEWAMRAADQRGWNRLNLWVLDGNERAQAFYEAMGSRPDGIRKAGYVADTQILELRYVRT